MGRLFTLREAEELLPSVERWLREAIESKKNAAEAEAHLNAMLLRIHVFGGIQVDVPRAAELKTAKEKSEEHLRQALEEFENNGVVVKDLDIGLIDFPTLFDGEEVYLCWKLGETGIGFWHHTTEGYAGRKQIDGDFLERHKGGRPH